MHETVLENILSDNAGAFGLRGQRHELRLHVGGKTGIFFGDHVGGSEWIVSHDANGVGILFALYADLRQFGHQRAQMLRVASGDVEITCGQDRGDDKRSGFDAVRNDAMLRAVKLIDSCDPNCGSTRALDPCSHFV